CPRTPPAGPKSDCSKNQTPAGNRLSQMGYSRACRGLGRLTPARPFSFLGVINVSTDKQLARRESRHYREQCRGLLNKSSIPAAVAKTLNLILDYMGSPSDYTLAWVSHAALARTQELSERTIEWHCKAIAGSGLLLVEKLGLREARKRLEQEFSYTLK